eukprot:CAMPEP_0170491234 /NCGR_PEP_ID=MMETSP0208-20121228/10656_1 /TAXON_ID=197538 /ORGANISM="Strombidium inclinatum, Strain S3" /LENGTH=261 /DNA_ID=CAMNT_0010766777 /DNA_START=45 /DNA_END=827 /DNA_ORIENTATION=+
MDSFTSTYDYLQEWQPTAALIIPAVFLPPTLIEAAEFAFAGGAMFLSEAGTDTRFTNSSLMTFGDDYFEKPDASFLDYVTGAFYFVTDSFFQLNVIGAFGMLSLFLAIGTVFRSLAASDESSVYMLLDAVVENVAYLPMLQEYFANGGFKTIASDFNSLFSTDGLLIAYYFLMASMWGLVAIYEILLAVGFPWMTLISISAVALAAIVALAVPVVIIGKDLFWLLVFAVSPNYASDRDATISDYFSKWSDIERSWNTIIEW